MSLQDFFIYDSNDVSGTCFTSAVNNEQYQIQEVFIIYKTTNQIKGFILGGKPKSESFKEKMKKPKSKEHVQKVINALLGIKHTEERKQKNSESNKMYIWIYNSELKIRKRHKKDQPISEGWIRGMGPMSEENKKYLSEIRKINGTFKGKNNPMYGSKYYWVYNPITKQRKRNPLDQPIPEGWIKGKKII